MRFFFAIFLALVPACAATLSVTVANVDKRGGELHVALYDETSWSNDDAKPIVDAIVPAIPPQTTVVMTDVAPGIYGVKTYQDANKNDRFDEGLFGIPLERYGFSRDARPRFAEPKFERTKFAIVPGENAIVIHLQ